MILSSNKNDQDPIQSNHSSFLWRGTEILLIICFYNSTALEYLHMDITSPKVLIPFACLAEGFIILASIIIIKKAPVPKNPHYLEWLLLASIFIDCGVNILTMPHENLFIILMKVICPVILSLYLYLDNHRKDASHSEEIIGLINSSYYFCLFLLSLSLPFISAVILPVYVALILIIFVSGAFFLSFILDENKSRIIPPLHYVTVELFTCVFVPAAVLSENLLRTTNELWILSLLKYVLVILYVVCILVKTRSGSVANRQKQNQ